MICCYWHTLVSTILPFQIQAFHDGADQLYEEAEFGEVWQASQEGRVQDDDHHGLLHAHHHHREKDED